MTVGKLSGVGDRLDRLVEQRLECVLGESFNSDDNGGGGDGDGESRGVDGEERGIELR